MSEEFCKVCGGYKSDCPQHRLCPNQDPALVQMQLDMLDAERAQLTEMKKSIEKSVKVNK